MGNGIKTELPPTLNTVAGIFAVGIFAVGFLKSLRRKLHTAKNPTAKNLTAKNLTAKIPCPLKYIYFKNIVGQLTFINSTFISNKKIKMHD